MLINLNKINEWNNINRQQGTCFYAMTAYIGIVYHKTSNDSIHNKLYKYPKYVIPFISWAAVKTLHHDVVICVVQKRRYLSDDISQKSAFMHQTTVGYNSNSIRTLSLIELCYCVWQSGLVLENSETVQNQYYASAHCKKGKWDSDGFLKG